MNRNNFRNREFLKIHEAAAYLDRSRWTIWRMETDGLIKSYKKGKKKVFKKSELKKFIIT